MKKKIVVIVSILLICFIVLSAQNVYANAGDSINSVIGGTSSSSAGKKGINSILNPIIIITKITAVGIAVIMLTALSIKYMTAAPTERANIKNNMITFAVGAILVFGAANIVELAMKFSQNSIK